MEGEFPLPRIKVEHKDKISNNNINENSSINSVAPTDFHQLSSHSSKLQNHANMINKKMIHKKEESAMNENILPFELINAHFKINTMSFNISMGMNSITLTDFMKSMLGFSLKKIKPFGCVKLLQTVL